MLSRSRSFCALALVALLAIAGPSSAQQEQTPSELLHDFVWSVAIARPEVAASYATALLDRGLSDKDLAQLVDNHPKRSAKEVADALITCQKWPQVERIAAELGKRIEDGRLELAREQERIRQAIKDLVGNLREARLAEKRLLAAGEFAIPELLREIIQGEDERLKIECIRLLPKFEQHAVAPLCAALMHVDDLTQLTICQVLGELGRPQAAPYLLELAQHDPAPQPVREEANRAYRRVGGESGNLSIEWTNLSRTYFLEILDLVPFPTEPTNTIWGWDKFVGLKGIAVPTPVYSQILSMNTALKAVEADQSNMSALALFVAANLKRENQLPDGTDDPIFGETAYTPSFYATVFGTETCRDVLAMAIDAGDTVLVRDAIEALSQTTGGSNLFAGAAGRSPLLESLQYPDRRVRYDAALVLGKALPQDGFSGDFTVVPMLGSAIRAGAQTFAYVLADNDETRRVNVERLNELGFTVVGQAGEFQDAQADLADAIAVDLVIVQKAAAPRELSDLVNRIRAQPKSAVAAIVIIGGPTEVPNLEMQFANNRWVKVTGDVGDEAFSLVIEDALERASGGRITEAEAEIYAFEAMGALRDIAVSNSPVYNIADAEPALLDALETRTGGARLLIAKTLTYINSSEVQQRLFEAALDAADDQIELLNDVADSIKRWGYKAEPRHLDGLLMLIAEGAPEVTEAAARVHGAINLPPISALDLLPEQKQ